MNADPLRMETRDALVRLVDAAILQGLALEEASIADDGTRDIALGWERHRLACNVTDAAMEYALVSIRCDLAMALRAAEVTP